jgi:hypothetical protein
MNEFEDGEFIYYESSSMFHGSLLNIMGTRFDIIIIGKSKGESEAVWHKIESELKRLNRILNRFDPARLKIVNLNQENTEDLIFASQNLPVPGTEKPQGG